LIVDDEKKRLMLQAILEEEGYRVRGADSGGRAVAILKGHQSISC
jgi:CheY-like chemotaxis protein